MAKFNDTSGIPNTCLKIDEVISFVDSLEIEENYQTKQDVIDIMEAIRAANDDLRNHGIALQGDNNDLGDEAEDLKRIISDLREEICDLKGEISELGDQITEKDEEINNLQERLNEG